MNSKLSFIILTFLCLTSYYSESQIVFWTETFNNGCSSNCNASSYSGLNGAWSVANSGSNGNIANEFFVSCAENGQPVGSCGAGCGNDATLHIGSVPCALCLLCPSGDCGASYNAGPAFAGEDPLTNKRAQSPLISTLGKSGITLSFKYIERGQGTGDDGSVEYSINGGAAWIALTNTAKTPNICPGGQGLWTNLSYSLPATCDNISTLKIGFRWVNNSNGIGNDPSYAVDSVTLSSNIALPPIADFNTSLLTFCDSSCVSFTDLSQNSPSTWSWLFPGAIPATYLGQSPVNICYNTPGTYDVTLVVSNSAGTDTILKQNYITVNSCFLPQVSFSATDTFFCEKGCINFSDLSTNNPTSWMWYFTGASPDTSTLQNPTGICYNAYGSFNVKMVASNVIGSDSAVYSSFITVNQNPPSPTASLSGNNILTCSPFSQYQWYFNSVPIPGAVNQVHLAQSTGNYFVVITDSNGCIATSNLVFVGFAGIADQYANQNIQIYPNPVSDWLNIHIDKCVSGGLKMELTDVSGRRVITNDFISENDKEDLKINISALEPGTYFINFKYNTGFIIKKLSKF